MRCVAWPGSRIAAALLCIVLAWISVNTPHCDRCDGPRAIALTSTHGAIEHLLTEHTLPVEPDDCNGVCACCGFHWLPDIRPLPSPVERVSIAPHGTIPEFRSASRPLLFRPPRISVSA